MTLLPVHVHKGTPGGLTRLHSEMDDLLGGFFECWDMPFFERRRWPAIDIADNENEITVNAEIPGCKAADIDISVQGNILTISGERKQHEEKEGKDFYHVETRCGSFRRQLNLPSDVDADKIEAVCKDGVLTITLSKAEEAKAVKVKVKTK